MLGKISFNEVKSVFDKRILDLMDNLLHARDWDCAVLQVHMIMSLIATCFDIGCITLEEKRTMQRMVMNCLNDLFPPEIG